MKGCEDRSAHRRKIISRPVNHRPIGTWVKRMSEDCSSSIINHLLLGWRNRREKLFSVWSSLVLLLARKVDIFFSMLLRVVLEDGNGGFMRVGGFCLCLLSPLFGDGEAVCEQAHACYCVIFCRWLGREWLHLTFLAAKQIWGIHLETSATHRVRASDRG